jgi:hypothetical protein
LRHDGDFTNPSGTKTWTAPYYNWSQYGNGPLHNYAMKKKIILILMVALFLSYSCSNRVNKMFNSDLQDALVHFRPAFVEEFEYFNVEDIRTYRYSFPESNEKIHTGAHFIARVNINDCDSLNKLLCLKSINITKQTDIKNIDLRLHSPENSNYITDLEIFCDSNRSIILPNLNYELNDSMLINYNNSDSYTFFIIELNNSCTLNDNLKWDNNIMPQQWEHGYSKGIALNCIRKKAFAWIILW